MKTLQDCKNDVAIKYGYAKWWDFVSAEITKHAMTNFWGFLDEAAELYAQSRVSELERENELLKVRDTKREKKFERLNKENGGLYAEKERLEKENQLLRNEIGSSFGPHEDNSTNYAEINAYLRRDMAILEKEVETLREVLKDVKTYIPTDFPSLHTDIEDVLTPEHLDKNSTGPTYDT